VEIGIGLTCARQQKLPAVYGLTHRDERVDLHLVQGAPVDLASGTSLGLYYSSTFGGQVAAVAVRSVPFSDG
jgi:hypothetical protein